MKETNFAHTMSYCPNCGKLTYHRRHGYEIFECDNCYYEGAGKEAKVISFGDRIRSMTDRDLAHFLCSIGYKASKIPVFPDKKDVIEVMNRLVDEDSSLRAELDTYYRRY